jgi:GAF domain-containing protein
MKTPPDSALTNAQGIIAELRRQLDEALAQQQATAEVLQVINSSPGDLAPVFDAMLEKAMRLCEAAFGQLSTYDGERFHRAAVHGEPRFAAWLQQRGPVRAPPDTPLGRLLRGERIFHIADAVDDDAYRANARYREMVDRGGLRSTLSAPLRKDGALLGAITVYRQEVRPFSDKQIALVQNFAAQAVIAMENARLITETREALERETATAEVLQVINASPGDLTPVFDAILEKAHTLCGAVAGTLFLRDGERFRAVAIRGDVPEAFAERLRQGFVAGDVPVSAPLLAGEPFVHIPDLASVDHPMARAGVEISGTRTLLSVPLRQGDSLLGMIVGSRKEVRPFSDDQIALLQNFAAQAVIAMENARLITETREALDQQTATAEVLQVINSSPGDLGPVFDAMLEKATELCEAAFGNLWIYDGERFRSVALRGASPALSEFLRDPQRPGLGTTLGEFQRGAALVHLANVANGPAYLSGDAFATAFVELGGARTVLGIPLLKDGVLLGAITAFRREVRPFTHKQIALLQNFAAQAVIAMENARLITETREALEQQTATAEVLGVINSSPGDLAPVFDAMLEKALRLCEAAFGSLLLYDGEALRAAALRSVPKGFADFLSDPLVPAPGTALAQVIDERRLIHWADAMTQESYLQRTPLAVAGVELGGVRTLVGVPLIRDRTLLGIFHLYRQEVRPFTGKQIALLQSFAAQAVIAMENARLITETREALDQQTATAEVLQVINSSPGDLAPVFESMLERATRLCDGIQGVLWTIDAERVRLAAPEGVPMTIIFRVRSDFLAEVRTDLHRRHAFAAERVGFIICRAGRLTEGGLAILAAGYDAVADEDYVEDRTVGAMMGPSAIRKALQRAYNGGAEDLSIFHVHMHAHLGRTGFSAIDARESRKFVPDFFNVAPAMPHGAIVLSLDQAVGLCWPAPGAAPVPIDRFASVGAPLKMWRRG